MRPDLVGPGGAGESYLGILPIPYDIGHNTSAKSTKGSLSVHELDNEGRSCFPSAVAAVIRHRIRSLLYV